MRMLLPLAFVCALAPGAEAQRGLEGTWQGYWIRSGDSLPVRLTVRPDTAPGRFRATFGSERLRVSGIPFAEARVDGCCDVTMVLRGDRTTTTFTGRVQGDSLAGTLTENGAEGRFVYTRAAVSAAEFSERDVTFANGEVRLAGTLLMPAGGTPAAGVVFLHGSGGEGRFASRFLAEQAATHGVAALIFDKRGVGGSSGDWRTAAPDDLARDAIAAVEFLAAQQGIDPRRVGIHGHSQGGTLAPMVAALSPRVRFVVASAAAGVPTDSVELFSILNSMRSSTQSPADSADAARYVAELVDVAYHGRGHARLDSLANTYRDRAWFFPPPPPGNVYWTFSRAFGRYDPLAWWARIRVPVLLVYGGDDQRVPARESAARIAAALRRAGNGDVTVRIFPGADHTFRLAPGPSGWPSTAPDYLPTLVHWLSAR
ncbi:MAG TPA: alpha/beta fold hydrolase [Longimicrobium sp.]